MPSFKTFSQAHATPGKSRAGGKPKDPSRPRPDAPAAPPNKALAKDMARYGITWVPVDYYHYGVFRYTNLEDAIAQAKRDGQR